MFRIAYFGSLANAFDAPLPTWQYVAAIGLSLVGTSLAAAVLMRMSNESFRWWSRQIAVSISILYLIRGAWLLATG
jgi:hypothetical protein